MANLSNMAICRHLARPDWLKQLALLKKPDWVKQLAQYWLKRFGRSQPNFFSTCTPSIFNSDAANKFKIIIFQHLFLKKYGKKLKN